MLLEPVVVTAFGVAIAQTRAAAGLVGDVVFEIGAGGGPAAAGPGAGGVPDFGQVPEHHPGIVPPGLPPVVAVPGGDRADPGRGV